MICQVFERNKPEMTWQVSNGKLYTRPHNVRQQAGLSMQTCQVIPDPSIRETWQDLAAAKYRAWRREAVRHQPYDYESSKAS